MSRDLRTPGGRLHLGRWLIGGSVTLLLLLQLGAMRVQSPLRDTVSDLVYAPAGHMLFPLMGVLCLTGAGLIANVLSRQRLRLAAATVGLWCVALAAATAFPTDPPGTEVVSVVGNIHRYAAAVMFVATPLAGWFVATSRRLTGVSAAHRARLRAASIWCALIGIGQFAVSIPSLFPDAAMASSPAVIALADLRGLAERLLFVSMMLVLVRIGENLRTAHVTAVRAKTRHGAPSHTRGGDRHRTWERQPAPSLESSGTSTVHSPRPRHTGRHDHDC